MYVLSKVSTFLGKREIFRDIIVELRKPEGQIFLQRIIIIKKDI